MNKRDVIINVLTYLKNTAELFNGSIAWKTEHAEHIESILDEYYSDNKKSVRDVGGVYTHVDYFYKWMRDHPEGDGISISKNKYNTTVCLWNITKPNRQMELNFSTKTGELTDWFVNDEEN